METRLIDWAELGLVIPEPAGMLAWLRAGDTPLAATLRAGDPDAPLWAWGEDQHVRFWSRRMVHETTVHRRDAELVTRRTTPIDGALAADGVEEFLVNTPYATRRALTDPGVRTAGDVALVAAMLDKLSEV